MKTLLRGGFVASGRGCRRADVLIDGETIAMVGHIPPELAAQSEIVDVTGAMLFPGFIDAHTHFDLDVCNTTTADDFESGSKSAIRGGTTTVIDFACPNKGESLAYGLDLWHKKADGKCYCDYGFHMTIDDWNESIESELNAMIEAGITSFKMYLTYPAMMIGDGAVYSALKALKKRGGIAGVHCENAGVIDARIAELKASGLGADVVSHPVSRPDYLEAEAVSRLLRIAQAADAPVIIVHTTNRASLAEIAAARRRGKQRPQIRAAAPSAPRAPAFRHSSGAGQGPPHARGRKGSAQAPSRIRARAAQRRGTPSCAAARPRRTAGMPLRPPERQTGSS